MSAAQVTVFTKHATAGDPTGTLLSKRISLVDGKLFADGSPCRMVDGTADSVPAGTAQELADIIGGLSGENALALGSIKDHARAKIVTARALAKLGRRATSDGLPVIARTREHIDYQPGAGWMLADFDRKGMPSSTQMAITDVGGAWKALLSLAPGLARAARMTRASTSTGLSRIDTGEALLGSGGEHHYILVADATDIDRALSTLHDHCWLHGYGWYLIGASGRLLERSLVDSSVRFGERLSFEGAPEVIPPLTQDATARAPVAHDGVAIDTRIAIPSLTDYQMSRVEEAKRAARRELQPRAEAARAAADRKLADAISRRTSVPFAAAMRAVAARHRGVLSPHVMLEFDHHQPASVGDVLADPEAFVGETLADPLDGVEYGRGKAMVLRSSVDPEQLLIYSFAHGGGTYQLRHDAQTVRLALDKADTGHVVDVFCALIGQAEIGPDEMEQLTGIAAGKAKVGVRAIKSRLKTDKAARDGAVRKAAHDQAVANDQRLSHPLPFSDGERTPVIKFVDETLAADTSAEPPMRDATGRIVKVRTIEPWGLHQLTATGSNAEPHSEGQELLHAPPEPTLAPLTPTGVGLLIEQYIRFETAPTENNPGHAAALQRPFIDALMVMSAAESQMPVVRIINTAPLVAMNGTVIAGIGLDRTSGIFHLIESWLLDCLPEAPPTEEDVREATKWLMEEWLVDVKTDTTGKLLALMLCLSMIERALLPERPGWIVSAGQRGGGKTTLIHMLTMAVFGRMAPAAAWAQTEDERRKALFAYLRQALAVLVWDNIPRGTLIASAAIEKSLTSPEISDRVLKESTSERAPANTVQIFNGNNIGPKGDMCSRNFRIDINVDRPDPENRNFTHADVLTWTLQNRPRIMKCLYTILVYGCQQRPVDQVPKTRFKTWWSLCGWPIELAATLIGHKIDCIELLRAVEGKDEETAAAASMLAVLNDEFGDAEFTAKDIAGILEAGNAAASGAADLLIPVDRARDAVKTERANRFLDALNELVERRMERPTAYTIGKLLRSRLVDRPTYIDDITIVTLKAGSVNNTNTYTIHRRRTQGETGADVGKPTAEHLSATNGADGNDTGEQRLEGDRGDTGDSTDDSEVEEHEFPRASGDASAATDEDADDELVV